MSGRGGGNSNDNAGGRSGDQPGGGGGRGRNRNRNRNRNRRGRGGGGGGRGGGNGGRGGGDDRRNTPQKREHESPVNLPGEPARSSGNSTKKLAHMTESRFADLPIAAESRRAMAEVFRYETMTEVQAKTLPLILADGGRDCMAKAKTGTGKTLAFMIPTVEKLMVHMKKNNARASRDIGCLVISPTRELAQQIGAETEKLLSFQNNSMRKVVVCVGGTNRNKDVRALEGVTPIVIATPGRLLDHLESGLAERMANLDTLVFDEADQLLDMGFRPDVLRILKFLQPSASTRQTLLFSATIPDQVEVIAGIAMRPQYNFVDTVGEEEQTHLHVRQSAMVSRQEHQIEALFSILQERTSSSSHKVIVFFTTARLTQLMAEMFNSVSDITGYNVLEIHSRKSQSQREKASEKFRKSRSAVMFSSDVTARGMDYPDVTYVLQVGLTEQSQYIHRLGRTARAGKDGEGGLLLADYEEGHMLSKELRDMPIERTAVPRSPVATTAAQRAIANVGTMESLGATAEQAYRAWLGYYNGNLRKCRWDKRQLVQQANTWAIDVGLKEQPGLQKKTIGKMGLKGTPGLRIEN